MLGRDGFVALLANLWIRSVARQGGFKGIQVRFTQMQNAAKPYPLVSRLMIDSEYMAFALPLGPRAQPVDTLRTRMAHS